VLNPDADPRYTGKRITTCSLAVKRDDGYGESQFSILDAIQETVLPDSRKYAHM